MESMRPRKQRKELFNAPLHKRRKWISSHLEENLLLKYDKRAIPVIKGDTVKIMRGSFKGHEDKVARVDVRGRYIEIEGITISKADGNKIAKPIHASNVMIIKLNLTDKRRRKKLERGLSEETKKEIEKEAEQQIRETEEKKKKEKEEKELEKIAEEKEETKETEEPEKKEEKPKVEEVKGETEKKTSPKTEKKPAEKKKTSPKSKTAKKTTTKTTKKKEEEK